MNTTPYEISMSAIFKPPPPYYPDEPYSVMVQQLKYMGLRKGDISSLLKQAALKADISPNTRCSFVRVFRVFPDKFRDEKLFQTVADLILESKDQAIKLEAAKTIVAKYSLTPDRHQEILRKVMESEKSGDGGRYLREHLDIDALK